jgi:DNA-binding NtrC family response regulator
MSRVLNEGTVGNMTVVGQPPPSETAAIGVTFGPGSENPTLRRVRDEAEVQVILHTLQHTGWNRKRAAALLKISYRGLLYKIRRHSITPTTVR